MPGLYLVTHARTQSGLCDVDCKLSCATFSQLPLLKLILGESILREHKWVPILGGEFESLGMGIWSSILCAGGNRSNQRKYMMRLCVDQQSLLLQGSQPIRKIRENYFTFFQSEKS